MAIFHAGYRKLWLVYLVIKPAELYTAPGNPWCTSCIIRTDAKALIDQLYNAEPDAELDAEPWLNDCTGAAISWRVKAGQSLNVSTSPLLNWINWMLSLRLIRAFD